MRIGMMADTYKPHVSGITNYIALNKRYLEQAGHEVYVFTFGDLEYEDDEPRIVRSPGLPLVDTGYYLSFSYSRRAKDLLLTMDVVHVHHPFLSGRLALRYCRPLRIPVVFTNHTRYDLYAQAYLPMLPDEVSATFLETYMPPFCQAVDLVVSPSAGMARVLRDLGVDSPIEIIPNGVEMERIQEPVEPVARERIGFAKNDVVLAYVGRLGPEKNLDFLLRAFAGTAGAVENARLLIVGGGPAMDDLRAQADQLGIAGRVRFTGMVPYEQLPSYLAMCDAFVTASVTEVHPLSVIEAMGAGLPVLGIHSPGVGDTVEDGQTGFLATQDLAAFTAKMTRLCLLDEQRRAMGATARLAADQYDIRRTTALMLEQYEKLFHASTPHKRRMSVRLRSLLERFRR